MRDRPRFSIRSLLIAIACFAILCWGCNWVISPRMPAWKVEAAVRESLPIGTSKKDVQAWLDGRCPYPPSCFEDSSGHTTLQGWITNTGPPIAIIPDDIRMEFEFDNQDKLVNFSVVSESRF